ncbi:MAG: zinc metallopeptidase [Flavobacteriales bacterium]|nr:zinc metallopeptidase [Flavobacteriales bacterium]
MMWLIIILFMLLGMVVSGQLKRRFREYSRGMLSSGLSGREIAEKMLRDNRINDVNVISVKGQLTDHYNPTDKTINLSEEVYHGRSIAAAAVAAHETGHAVQHATDYAFLKLRSSLVPVVSISSKFMHYILLGGMFIGFSYMMYLDKVLLAVIIAQSLLALFSLITLPVEIDASQRALAWLNSSQITRGEEHDKAANALKWAGMTYVVAALSSIAMLLYFVMQFAGRRD